MATKTGTSTAKTSTAKKTTARKTTAKKATTKKATATKTAAKTAAVATPAAVAFDRVEDLATKAQDQYLSIMEQGQDAALKGYAAVVEAVENIELPDVDFPAVPGLDALPFDFKSLPFDVASIRSSLPFDVDSVRDSVRIPADSIAGMSDNMFDFAAKVIENQREFAKKVLAVTSK